MKISLLFVALILTLNTWAQPFKYRVDMEAVNVNGFPGLHSYAFAQHNGKWLLIGGRTDGLHARQPFASFPVSNSNTDIFVIDIDSKNIWSASVNTLPTGIKEQLQSSNMNFYQYGDTLYLIGGYAYSQTAADHITFDALTSVQVSTLINDIVNGNSISGNFKQINNANFAVTGGQLGMIGNTFYLVGGHQFDGRYNPMGHNTYTQTYSNQIRKFRINNKGIQLSYSNYAAVTDALNLHRRDYNLVPQIFPDGSEGYTISSGVFQTAADLPYLYPVDIKQSGITPITSFNQYLSNYHCATLSLYDSLNNEMHNLFFGGMSQYYYSNDSLIQDNNVPFVKTISRLSRDANGNLHEFQLSEEMPDLVGASAEFILNEDLPHYGSEIIKLDKINEDSILAGYIVGGIYSPALNPFNGNNTSVTTADENIYKVWLIKDEYASSQPIAGQHPYDMTIFPNPVKDKLQVEFDLPGSMDVEYYFTDVNGAIIFIGYTDYTSKGKNNLEINLKEFPSQTLFLTLVFNSKFFVTKRVVKE